MSNHTFRTNICQFLGGLLRCASSHIRTWSQSGEHISSISKPRNSEATITIRRSFGHLLGYRFDLSRPSAETRTGTRGGIASRRPQQRRCNRILRGSHSAGEVEQKEVVGLAWSIGRPQKQFAFIQRVGDGGHAGGRRRRCVRRRSGQQHIPCQLLLLPAAAISRRKGGRPR